MQFDFLKQFKPENGERYVVVENGEPLVVVLSFEDYKKILNNKKDGNPQKINSPKNNLPDFQNSNEGEAVINFDESLSENDNYEGGSDNKEKVEELKNELKRELTLDDLPF